MAKSLTALISVNGWKNLGTLASAAGYTGNPILREGTVLNFNATVAYLHITADGATNPTTASDGLPIGTTSSTAPSASYTLPDGTDINLVWINTSGAQNIRYAVTGR